MPGGRAHRVLDEARVVRDRRRQQGARDDDVARVAEQPRQVEAPPPGLVLHAPVEPPVADGHDGPAVEAVRRLEAVLHQLDEGLLALPALELLAQHAALAVGEQARVLGAELVGRSGEGVPAGAQPVDVALRLPADGSGVVDELLQVLRTRRDQHGHTPPGWKSGVTGVLAKSGGPGTAGSAGGSP